MKRNSRRVACTVIALFYALMSVGATHAEEKNPEHLLDGVTVNYYYQTGLGLKVAFYDGMVKYEQIAGPPRGGKGVDIPYQSRKIGDGIYLVNWHEPNNHDFLTFVFNLKTNVMYSSAILRYGTEKQMYHFSGGIMEHVTGQLK